MTMLRRAPLVALLLALLAPAAAALGISVGVSPAAIDVAVAAEEIETVVDLDDLPLTAAMPLSRDLVETLPLTSAVNALPQAVQIGDQPPQRTQGAAPMDVIAQTEPATALAVGGGLVWLLMLYFRVQPDNLLENERRERVLTLVRERPGIGPSEIAQALDTGWGATMYHLDRLERAGLVMSRRMGHHRCYFVPGALPKDAQAQAGLFRGDTTRRVAQLLLERPGLTQTQLCQALGLSASAASKQVSRLEAAALVRRESAHDGTRVYPQPTLSGALAPVAA